MVELHLNDNLIYDRGISHLFETLVALLHAGASAAPVTGSSSARPPSRLEILVGASEAHAE